MPVVPVDARAHERFLDAYYGRTAPTYDLTRKYYLFGRDVALRELLAESWSSLVEIGPGTGRNLAKLHAQRPRAAYGGVDASRAMLDVARTRCPWASLAHGLAEDFDYRTLVGGRPDRILFSYSLSMIPRPSRALARARRSLAPGGEIVVVDFGPIDGVPRPVRDLFRAWLRAFHVRPIDPSWLGAHATRIERGPLGYYVIARIAAD